MEQERGEIMSDVMQALRMRLDELGVPWEDLGYRDDKFYPDERTVHIEYTKWIGLLGEEAHAIYGFVDSGDGPICGETEGYPDRLDVLFGPYEARLVPMDADMAIRITLGK